MCPPLGPRRGSLEKSAYSGRRRATSNREIGVSARNIVIWYLIYHLNNREPRRLTKKSTTRKSVQLETRGLLKSFFKSFINFLVIHNAQPVKTEKPFIVILKCITYGHNPSPNNP